MTADEILAAHTQLAHDGIVIECSGAERVLAWIVRLVRVAVAELRGHDHAEAATREGADLITPAIPQIRIAWQSA